MSDYLCSLGGFHMSLIQQQGLSGGFVKDLSNKQLTCMKHAEYLIYELLIQHNIMSTVRLYTNVKTITDFNVLPRLT